MSAWYLFSSLGFYPVSPGLPEYKIGTPRFDDMTVRLPSGARLHIVAHGTESGSFYVQSVTWNGRPVHDLTLSHSDLVQGGELVFTMSAKPYTQTSASSR
jgi:putative alpha-1,2-mannosidase